MLFKAADFIHPRYWATWLGIGIMRIFSLLTWKGQQRLGRYIGLLAFYLVKSRRRVAQINIDLCFPELNQTQRDVMLKEHFEHNGKGFVELGTAWWMSTKRYKQLSTLHGEEHLNKALAEGSVLLLGVHFTSLESAGRALNAHGYKFQCMYKPAKEPLFNAFMCAKRRSYLAALVSNREGKLFSHSLKQGLLSWYAPDQSFNRSVVHAPLFKQNTTTLTSTSNIAAYAEAQVLPMFCIRSADGEGYEVHILPPLKNFPSGDQYADACNVNAATEEMINYAPAQYLWGHRRFKHMQDGSNPYTRV